MPDSPGWLDQDRDRISVGHYSIRTEKQYAQWTRRLSVFHDSAIRKRGR